MSISVKLFCCCSEPEVVLKVQIPLVALTAVLGHIGGSSKRRGQVQRHQEAPPAKACQ